MDYLGAMRRPANGEECIDADEVKSEDVLTALDQQRNFVESKLEKTVRLQFLQHLNFCSRIVAAWPKWKREVLGPSSN